jgi:DNA modification methylase
MGATFYEDPRATLYLGDARAVLVAMSDESAQCCVTSPPYWGLRDYGADGQLGLEASPDEYVSALVAVFREVRRVLRDDGTLWLNLGDSYARAPEKGGTGTPNGRNKPEMGYTGAKPLPSGLKPKDLVGIPWRVAFALQADGWWLRSDIIWHKPNPMPESVTDRPTKAHEYVFLLAKSETYFYDADAVKEPAVRGHAGSRFDSGKTAAHQLGRASATPRVDDGTRNRRSVWSIATRPFKGAHFATFPPALVEPCILAGSRPGDVVLDPFNGAGTTGMVAMQRGRRYVGVELNPDYAQLAVERWQSEASQHLLFAEGL